jgi:ABC-type glutathione transport system ATPase component
MALLDVENLSLAFGRHVALKGLCFGIDAGETVVLVGESGSGKSATALAIMRLIERDGGRITGGSITLGGTDLTAMTDAGMRRVRGNRLAMIFQEPMTALNPVMPLGAQVAEVLRLHRGLDAAAARAAVLEAFGRVRIPQPELRLGQYPHELSGGLRQRVMIAMALACRPDLLIADEPTTALDVTTQAEILALIKALQAETGMAVLFITHDMGVVAEIADRVVVLRQGEGVETGPVGRIFANPHADYIKMLMAATPRLGAGAPQPLRDPAPVLEVENLSVRFALPQSHPFAPVQEFHAVQGASLRIGRGETLGLVGESGCGKSTLARACLRLIPVDEGRVRLCGTALEGLDATALRPLRRQAQMVFQDPLASLNPRLPVVDLITEPAVIHRTVSRADKRDLAADLLRKVGLEPEAMVRFAHQFSGGQRQRLCIARALSVQPALIVADEAVSALDVSVARQITDLLARLQAEEGLSFLFISHDIAVVERVSHRIAVMHAGRIVETGPTERVLQASAHPYTRKLLSAVPIPDPAKRGWVVAVPEFDPSAPSILPKGQRPPARLMVEVGPLHFVLGGTDSTPLSRLSDPRGPVDLPDARPVAQTAEALP